ASLYVGNVFLVILNIPLIGLWVRLLKIPIQLMLALIGVLAITGAYGIANSMFDVWIALGFGVLGYLMRKRNIPTTPMILGLVLSHTLEQSLRQSLTLFAGDWTAFFTRPMSLTFIVLSVLCVIAPMLIRQLKQLKPQTMLAEKEKAAAALERAEAKN
ncbi:MAG TPA: tripartite tricarboxylate transporter permease, partial [Pseudolabrys sp.]|nr:tripartite tricarboxylate transporter permease [Pseudolabrys sp.]